MVHHPDRARSSAMRRTHRDLPDDFVARAFRVREAQLRGLTPRQLRGADLSAPFQGIRVVGAPHTIEEYCHAFLPRMREYVAFSEATAARILGLPVPWRLDRAQGLDLLVPSGRYCPQGRGIRPRRIRPDLWAVTNVRGLPVTPAPLTLALLAKKCEIVELVVLADAIVTSADNYPGRSGTALATIDELRAFAKSAGAIPGSARLRAALERARTGVESPRESQLRCILVDAGFPEPEINVDIHEGGSVSRSR